MLRCGDFFFLFPCVSADGGDSLQVPPAGFVMWNIFLRRREKKKKKANAVILQLQVSCASEWVRVSICQLLWQTLDSFKNLKIIVPLMNKQSSFCLGELRKLQKPVLTQMTTLQYLFNFLTAFPAQALHCYLPPVLVFVLRSLGLLHTHTHTLPAQSLCRLSEKAVSLWQPWYQSRPVSLWWC